MPLVMVGFTHQHASLRLLERVAVRHGDRGRLLVALRAAGCDEVVVVSTCSRTEVYAVGELGATRLISVLATHRGLDPSEVIGGVETRFGLDVARHLFRLAGGLASRVIGEVEIQGQVRGALLEARENGTCGPVLDRLFGTALLCGRRVRQETALGAAGRSLARQAVEVGLAAWDGACGPNVAVVGAGRMARVAVEALTSAGHHPVVLARDHQRAESLAPAARVRPLDDLVPVLTWADVVICATSAAGDVVTAEHVLAAASARGRRPLTVVDLSVPRNVDPSVAALAGVRLVDIQGLDDDLDRDPELAAALAAGEDIVACVVRRYGEDVAAVSAGPVISRMRDTVAQACRDELRRTAGRTGLTESDVDRIAHAVTGKLLHRPTLAARAAAADGDQTKLDGLAALFA